MTDLFLYQKLRRTSLQQRCIDDGSGNLYFRMKDGRGDVRLSRRDWDQLESRFSEEIAPSGKALRLSILLAIPFAIALLVIYSNLPFVKAAVDAIDGLLPGVMVFLITSGLPLFTMLHHMRAVRQAHDRVVASLAGRPRCAAPVRPQRKALNALEIAALVLVGPYLIVATYGTLKPDAFRNTPWTGTSLGPFEMAGLAVLAALAIFRWRSARQLREIPAAETLPEPVVRADRTRDILRRAQEQSGS